MMSGLPLPIATSWASADRSPPLLDALHFGNYFWQTLYLQRSGLLTGAAISELPEFMLKPAAVTVARLFVTGLGGAEYALP